MRQSLWVMLCGVALLFASACGVNSDDELSQVTKSVDDPPNYNWVLVGYGLERCSPENASCDDATSGPFAPRILAIYVDTSGTMRWTAKVIADSGFPTPAVNDTFDLGGLAADPNDPDILYLMAVFGGAPEYLYSYDLSTSSWSTVDTFSEPGGNLHYYGLGETCDDELTSVIRVSNTTVSSSSNPASLVSFPPSNPENYSAVYSIEDGYPFGDNAWSYNGYATWSTGSGGTSGHFVTDGTNYTYFSGISEAWLVGVMANPVKISNTLVPGYEVTYDCGMDLFLATNDGTTVNGPSTLYLASSGYGGAIELEYWYPPFEVDQPAFRDLANLPGWCQSATIECLGE